MALPEELAGAIRELFERYPERKAALLPAMHLVQKARGGWLSEESIAEIAELFEVPDAHVRGMVGFYDMFHDAPVGRHVVRLCKTLSCKLRGADEIRRHIRERFGVDHGETTGDGAFTFRCFECLGHCEVAPMMLVDEERHTNLDIATVSEILGALS